MQRISNHLRIALATLVVALVPLIAIPQVTSDQVPRERTIPLRQQIDGEMAESRFQLGPIRLEPELNLRNIGYDSNVFGTPENPVSDWTATVSAGVDALLPIGRKLYLRGAVLPEYTWFAELKDRRNLGGHFDGALLALFNRMSLEAGAGSDESLANVSSEIQRPVVSNTSRVYAKSEIDVLRRLSLFGDWEGHDLNYDQPADAGNAYDVTLLDRRDTVARGGIRYHFRPWFDIAVGAEKTRAEFDKQPEVRDNQSTATVIGIHYDRPRSFLELWAGQRKGEALNGSQFPTYSGTTGSYFASYFLRRRLELQAFGSRSIVPGLFVANPYFVEIRNGAGISSAVGSRTTLRLYGEIGTNDYPVEVVVGGENVTKRADDVKTYGGGFSFRLFRTVHLVIDASESKYTSNISGFDRSIFRVTSGLSFRGD